MSDQIQKAYEVGTRVLVQRYRCYECMNFSAVGEGVVVDTQPGGAASAFLVELDNEWTCACGATPASGTLICTDTYSAVRES